MNLNDPNLVPILGAVLGLIGIVAGAMLPRIRNENDKVNANIALLASYESRIAGLCKDNEYLRGEIKDLRAQFEIIVKQNAYIPDLEAMRAQQDADILKLTERVESL